MQSQSLFKGIALSTAMAFATTFAFATGAAADGYGRRSIKDAPYYTPFSWTGFYVGLNAGYAWGDSSSSTDVSCPTGGCFFTPASSAFISSANSGGLTADGFTGGVQAGYNIQSGNIVYGAEIDFNALDVNHGRGVAGLTPGGTTFVSTTGITSDWLFTARARLGMTLSPTLLAYVTGGLAVADLEVTNSFASTNVAPPIVGGSSGSSTKVGWTIGGGLEWAMTNNWTIKGEYLYVDLGSVDTVAVVPAAGFPNNFLATSADLSMHMARVGINYKF